MHDIFIVYNRFEEITREDLVTRRVPSMVSSCTSLSFSYLESRRSSASSLMYSSFNKKCGLSLAGLLRYIMIHRWCGDGTILSFGKFTPHFSSYSSMSGSRSKCRGSPLSWGKNSFAGDTTDRQIDSFRVAVACLPWTSQFDDSTAAHQRSNVGCFVSPRRGSGAQSAWRWSGFGRQNRAVSTVDTLPAHKLWGNGLPESGRWAVMTKQQWMSSGEQVALDCQPWAKRWGLKHFWWGTASPACRQWAGNSDTTCTERSDWSLISLPSYGPSSPIWKAGEQWGQTSHRSDSCYEQESGSGPLFRLVI